MSSFRFLHVSDTHLGYNQYGLRQRAVDIARSLKAALEHGVEEGVDFILLCGDFFDRHNTNPDDFLHAQDCLRVPLEAGIPVYAIAGNHDTTFWSRNSSWLDVLNESGYFDLLAPTFTEDGVVLEPWDEDVRVGAVVDDPAGRFRVVGVPHLASRTEALIPKIAAALPDGERPWTVMMMHLGLTGQVPNSHDALEKTALDPLRGKVDYVALGHYHKRYEADGWIYNPGGTEHRSSAEVHVEHGYHLVTVEGGRHRVDFFEGLRRPHHVLGYRVVPDETRESLKAALEGLLADLDLSDAPVVTLTLTGTVVDAYASLDVHGLQRELSEATDALLVRIQPELSSNDVHVRVDDGAVDRDAVEVEVLRGRLAAAWGDVDAATADRLVRGVEDLKEGALRGDDPEALYGLLEALDDAVPAESTPSTEPDGGAEPEAAGTVEVEARA